MESFERLILSLSPSFFIHVASLCWLVPEVPDTAPRRRCWVWHNRKREVLEMCQEADGAEGVFLRSLTDSRCWDDEPKYALTLMWLAHHLLILCLFHDMFGCLQENLLWHRSTQSPLASPASFFALITIPFISATGDSQVLRSLHVLGSQCESAALSSLCLTQNRSLLHRDTVRFKRAQRLWK